MIAPGSDDGKVCFCAFGTSHLLADMFGYFGYPPTVATHLRAGATPIWHTVYMAFNQPAGPPASHRQIERLLELLREAGHDDFRSARGPMGFTQRQGNGKFTRAEADALIAELEGDEHDPTAPPQPHTSTRLTNDERSAQSLPTRVLAAELQRRGWVVMEP